MTASTFDDQLKRAVDTPGDRHRDEIARELRMVTDELSTGESTAIAASLPPLQPSTSPRVLDAVRALDEATSLSAVLDTLVGHATARDLAVRFGAEIARARSLYGERFPAHLPHAADLFRDDLLRTLTGGDASLLADVNAA